VGQLRIIAGELRGRRIEVPAGTSVRPTADRVREALFAILGERAIGASVLDAYSGCGALGFEALSRGARAATFIELEPSLLRALRQTAERFGVSGRCSFVRGRAIDVLGRKGAPGPFDLILADPPYASSEVGAFVTAALTCLSPGGWIVIEREAAKSGPVAPGLPRPFRTERYGRAGLDFYGGPADGSADRPAGD
jgi:16S rRNA (guanine(966)-N(2))-methyltransferase RsmD